MSEEYVLGYKEGECMVKKGVMKVELWEKGIDKGIKEVNEYKKWLKDWREKFVKGVGDEGGEIGRGKFEGGVYEGRNEVKV